MSEEVSPYGIVLAVHQWAAEIKHSLDSLEKMPGVPLLIVDNDCGALDALKNYTDARPYTRLIQNVPSIGFAGAWNQGLQYLPTKYVLIMQPIIEINHEACMRMVEELEADDTIACVAPMMVKPNGECIAHTGSLILRAFPVEADQDQLVTHEHALRKYEYKMMKDCCLMIRRLSMFRYDLVHSHADYDWTMTAWKAGFKNVYLPEAKVVSRWMRTVYPNQSAYEALFLMGQGGLQAMDAMNDCGSYYATKKEMEEWEKNFPGKKGPWDFPATEIWTYNDPKTCKGNIGVFLADHDGCGTHRLKNPYRGLIQRGWNVMFTTFCYSNEENPYEFIDWCDIVVVQRASEDHMVKFIKTAKERGKKVIFEVDDFFHGLHETNPSTAAFKDNPHWLRNMEINMYQANAMTVSTPELKSQYGLYNKNTHVIPNYIDLGLVPMPILENNSGTIRIGWGGSQTHDADFLRCTNAIKRILAEFPQTRLVLIASDYRKLFEGFESQLEWIPPTWGHEDPVGDYMKTLNNARLDIGIAPVEDNVFNRCKCADAKTRVITKRGIIELGNLTEDDYTWHDKSWNKVLAIEKYSRTSGLRFTTKDGYQLDLTPDHRMWVNGDWKRAEDTSIGDTFTLENEFSGPSEYQTAPWPAVYSKSKYEDNMWDFVTAPNGPKITINERWGRLLGAFAGDGSFYNKQGLKISCDGIDQDWIDLLMDDFRQIGIRSTTEAKTTYDGTLLRCREVRGSSTQLTKFICSLGIGEWNGDKCPKRIHRIPEVIWNSPRSVQAAWLSGYFEADGTCSKETSISAVSKSEELARNIQRLLLGFGIVSTVKSVTNSCQTGAIGIYWKVNLRRAAADEFYSKIGFYSKRKKDKLETIIKKPHSNAYKMMQWIQPIVSIEPIELDPINVQVEGHQWSCGGLWSRNSDIKMVEYGAYGIVCVASSVEPYILFQKDGGTCFLAKSEERWYKYLKTLITDPVLRRDMSKKVQEYVWNNRGVICVDNKMPMADKIEKIIADLRAGGGHHPATEEPEYSSAVSYFKDMSAREVTKRKRAIDEAKMKEMLAKMQKEEDPIPV